MMKSERLLYRPGLVYIVTHSTTSEAGRAITMSLPIRFPKQSYVLWCYVRNRKKPLGPSESAPNSYQDLERPFSQDCIWICKSLEESFRSYCKSEWCVKGDFLKTLGASEITWVLLLPLWYSDLPWKSPGAGKKVIAAFGCGFKHFQESCWSEDRWMGLHRFRQ